MMRTFSKSASHGVAQIAGSCSYLPSDRVVNPMSTVIYTADTVKCNISYIHIEYDCVPISINDSTKEYNVCQKNIEITSDYGIIRSPAYPTRFQTIASECFRTIHVPNDKIICLWLNDLYIGSISEISDKDHVYTVDSVQT
ncbi:unnamed protein product [Rotaria sp. Silwood2]|nr:unnamed protein product [Rotaria sp. Silwood2]